jgi:hypothetical protein
MLKNLYIFSLTGLHYVFNIEDPQTTLSLWFTCHLPGCLWWPFCIGVSPCPNTMLYVFINLFDKKGGDP